jgi:hypothetical protein
MWFWFVAVAILNQERCVWHIAVYTLSFIVEEFYYCICARDCITQQKKSFELFDLRFMWLLIEDSKSKEASHSENRWNVKAVLRLLQTCVNWTTVTFLVLESFMAHLCLSLVGLTAIYKGDFFQKLASYYKVLPFCWRHTVQPNVTDKSSLEMRHYKTRYRQNTGQEERL